VTRRNELDTRKPSHQWLSSGNTVKTRETLEPMLVSEIPRSAVLTAPRPDAGADLGRGIFPDKEDKRLGFRPPAPCAWRMRNVLVVGVVDSQTYLPVLPVVIRMNAAVLHRVVEQALPKTSKLPDSAFQARH